MRIKDLKVGDHFQMKGIDVDGKQVSLDCTLRSYNGKNKYSVESDGITIQYDGNVKIVSELVGSY
jgi:hypothetical protein